MLLVANWRFANDPALSSDTLDRIEVLIGGSVRGGSRIVQNGPFYTSSFWVYGDGVDEGMALKFQIWNRDESALYEGLHVPQDITFSAGAVHGTTASPEILIVEGQEIIRKRIYVDSAQISNPHNGLSWITAFNSLEDALQSAGSFDTIWVAQGTYFPEAGSGRSATFTLSESVIIYGGFQSGDVSLAQRSATRNTMLSGDIGLPGISSDNCYHVVTATSQYAILDQCVIRDGLANGTGDDGAGGAITNQGFLTLRSCDLWAGSSTANGSIVLNTGAAARMILQDVSLDSSGSSAWIRNANAGRMTVVGAGVVE